MLCYAVLCYAVLCYAMLKGKRKKNKSHVEISPTLHPNSTTALLLVSAHGSMTKSP